MKLITKFYILSALSALVTAQDSSLVTVKTAFDDANIPGDLHITFNPSVLLEVTFPQSSGESVQVTAGVQLPRNATVGPPTFAVRGEVERSQTFVIAAVDPDAPTPQQPTSAQIRHFLGPNFIRGSSLGHGTKSLINETDPLSSWRQPTPPAGSDAHRYVFLLFEQPAGFNSQTLVNASTSIANFNISSFAEATGLGDPLAGTFIRVAPDPAV